MTRENSNALHNIVLLMSVIVTVGGDWSGDGMCAVLYVNMAAYMYRPMQTRCKLVRRRGNGVNSAGKAVGA